VSHHPCYDDSPVKKMDNCFHSRFDEVAKYYSSSNKNVTFEIKKVVLGYTAII